MMYHLANWSSFCFFSAPPAGGAGGWCVSARHPHVTLSRYCTIDMERRYILVVQNLGEAMKKTCKNTRRVTNDDGDATHFGREICVDGILHIGGNKAP